MNEESLQHRSHHKQHAESCTRTRRILLRDLDEMTYLINRQGLRQRDKEDVRRRRHRRSCSTAPTPVEMRFEQENIIYLLMIVEQGSIRYPQLL